MRFLFALLSLIWLTPAWALDPDTKVPYHLKVVLRVGDHPDLTDDFRARLKRDLAGTLQAALGNLGTSEIVDLNSLPADKWEPIWKTVDEKGMSALTTMNEVTSGKTHFLRVDFIDGQYEVQARQYDGSTGFVTPIIRKMQTHDRAFVARLAGLMIGRDFGIIATFDTVTNNRSILRFRAGELGSLDKWVKKDDVFAILQIRGANQRSAKGRTLIAERAENVLMQVLENPKDGICPCRMISRYDSLPKPSGVLGYRAVKLGTTTEPLKLQLVQQNGQPVNAPLLHVWVRGDDFPDTPNHTETIKRDGVFVSDKPLSNVAFVRVLDGDKNLARIPIELLDDRVDVRKITLTPGAELRAPLDFARREIFKRINEGKLMQYVSFKEIMELEKASNNQGALDRAQAALKLLEGIGAETQEDMQRLQSRIDEVMKDVKDPQAVKDMFKDLSLADCQKQLQILLGKQNELKEHIEVLQTAIREENDPNVQAKKKKVQEIIRQAQNLQNQAEYDKALLTYQQAIEEVKDEPKALQAIQAAYDNLKSAWEIKPGDTDHEAARKWIYEIWPTLGKFRDLQDMLPTAEKYLAVCKARSDRLTAKKMQLAGNDVVNRFGQEVEMALKNDQEEEDKKGLEALINVKNRLEKLTKDVDDFVSGAAPAPKPPAK